MTKESFLGVDGCKEGWVGVALNTNGRFQESILVDKFSELTKYFPDVEIIGVDMPVDLVNKPSRMADQLVRKKLGSKRGRSVFPAIPKFMIERKWIDMKADELNKESRRRLGCAFSRQTINLKNKILEEKGQDKLDFNTYKDPNGVSVPSYSITLDLSDQKK